MKLPPWFMGNVHQYKESIDRVKIGHFIRKGFFIDGVVHIGANDGYEIQFYIKLGAKRVVAVEPLYSAYQHLQARWGGDHRVTLFHCALSYRFGRSMLNITEGDGQGSSFLEEVNPPKIIGQEPSLLVRGDSLSFPSYSCNTLVIDTQGMELDVLKGLGEDLKSFDFLNIECSRIPIYNGEVPATEVISYLDSMGFDQDSPIEDHNDIMFLKKGIKPYSVTSTGGQLVDI